MNNVTKNYRIRVRISFDDNTQSNLNSKEKFWKYVSEKAKKNENVSKNLEYMFRRKFATNLKQALQQKTQFELIDSNRNYNVDEMRYWEDILHFRMKDESEKIYINDFIAGISKLQELKNEYFKNNREYQELLNKNILAAQIYFDVENISYASLGFDLNVEPLDKIVKLFDNNFELFCIFLNSYIPQSFFHSIDIYDNELPISVSIDFTDKYRDCFYQRQTPSNNYSQTVSSEILNQASKRDKAKWAWALANGSLLIPVILSLIILYIAFNKIEKLNELHAKQYEVIQSENDKMIQNYNRLLELQKDVYSDIIQKTKSNK